MEGGDQEDSKVVDDGHYVVIDNRRWRATDPRIPAALRTELVDELMSARRAVGAARRRGEARAEASARARVHSAKVALGERGHPWWEAGTPAQLEDRIGSAILTLVRHRGSESSICPSDAARIVTGSAEPDIMTAVRTVARRLAKTGDVVIEQRGQALSPDEPWSGPIRIRRAPGTPDP